MDSPLYILRRALREIPLALLSPSDSVNEVVFLERALSDSHHTVELGHLTGPRHVLTYDDLIERIFASDRTIVI